MPALTENPLVPLSEVAKLAGVGAGTLYRHFPTRDDLTLAAYQHDIERLTATADEVLERHASAKAAFIEWFETLAGYIRIKHGLGDAMHGVKVTGLGGKCLDVKGGSSSNGTRPQLWDCFGAANQLWTYSANNLVNKLTGKCLDVKDGATTNGAALQIWTCPGAAQQKWSGL